MEPKRVRIDLAKHTRVIMAFERYKEITGDTEASIVSISTGILPGFIDNHFLRYRVNSKTPGAPLGGDGVFGPVAALKVLMGYCEGYINALPPEERDKARAAGAAAVAAFRRKSNVDVSL